MKARAAILIGFALLLAHPFALQAQIPKTLAYQGIVTDAAGEIKPDGSYSFTFRLYDASSGGTALWTESKTISVKDGLFFTALGDQVVFPASLRFDRPFWLSIQVASEAELSPRIPLTSVGYSFSTLRADSAQHAVRADTAQVVTGAVTATNLADDAVTSAKILDGTIQSGDVAASFTAPYADTSDYALAAPPGVAGWSLTGNSGTTDGTHFIGTTDNVVLDFRVNNARILRLEPHATSPNVIGGYSGNSVTDGVFGATISGGGASDYVNQVTAHYGTVGGGYNNSASQTYVTVGGGYGNTASGDRSTIGGGTGNTASGGSHGTIGGGVQNSTSGIGSTVGGGSDNTASANRSIVGGGMYNTASGAVATVGGGGYNNARGIYSVVSGGGGASSPDSNSALGDYSAVGGGKRNTASGDYATVPGGAFNVAAGDYSFAAGYRAKANHNGAFVWADQATAVDFVSTAGNQFLVRASGGTKFYSNAGLTAGVTLAAGGGSWLSVSDRNLKANFRDEDGETVLAAIATMPVPSWNYKSQDPSIRHMGPMAQDFYAAFGLGEDSLRINTVDIDGINLLAIQALEKRTRELAQLKAELAAVKAENEAMKTKMARFESALQRLEAVTMAGDIAEGGETTVAEMTP